MFETTNQILMIMRVYHVPIRHWAIKKHLKTHFQERAIMRSKPSCPKPIFPRKLLYQWYPPKLWKITIFNGKIHYFYGHVQQLFVSTRPNINPNMSTSRNPWDFLHWSPEPASPELWFPRSFTTWQDHCPGSPTCIDTWKNYIHGSVSKPCTPGEHQNSW